MLLSRGMGLEARTGAFRVHDRRNVRLGASVSHATEGWRWDVRIRNVSLGGACMEFPQTIREGEEISLDFLAPTLWDPLTINARVAWVRPRSRVDPMTIVGVSFVHADPASVLALFELIQALAFD